MIFSAKAVSHYKGRGRKYSDILKNMDIVIKLLYASRLHDEFSKDIGAKIRLRIFLTFTC